MNVNPMELIQMVKGGSNPQQLMISILEKQMSNTPVGQNLLNLAKNGQTKDIEQFARNMFQQNGRDFDSEFQNFNNTFGF